MSILPEESLLLLAGMVRRGSVSQGAHSHHESATSTGISRSLTTVPHRSNSHEPQWATLTQPELAARTPDTVNATVTAAITTDRRLLMPQSPRSTGLLGSCPQPQPLRCRAEARLLENSRQAGAQRVLAVGALHGELAQPAVAHRPAQRL